ncbi:uncharacterized protein LOC144053555 isoform X2 [Vanacampus margaritifer]
MKNTAHQKARRRCCSSNLSSPFCEIFRPMSDEIEFFWESLISPGRNKRAAKSNKSKKVSKRKNNVTSNTDDIIPKKKKRSTFKDVLQSKKDKKKKKKKKKVLDLNSLFGSSDATATAESKPDMPNLRTSSNNRKCKSDHTIQDSKKKGQQKKKVVFDLPHDRACVKRPNFSSAHPKFPKECTELKKASITDCEWASPASAKVQHQSQPQDDDIEWDESNSQDLFITQNTFRPSSSDSSEEASYKATSPALQHNYLDHKKYNDKDSCQHPRKKKHQKTAKTRSAQKDRLHSRKKKYSVQTKGASPTREEESSRPNVKKLYDEIYTGRTPKVAKSKPDHHKPIQQTLSCSLHIPVKPTTCTSTQTQNFFTAELSSYLAFSTKRRLAVCSDVVKPLDLSLPQRARKDLDRCLHVNVPSEVKEDETWAENKSSQREISATLFGCSAMKELEGKKAIGGSAKRKGETAFSPLTESESKSSNTTTSSDCNGQSKTVDLNQV